MSLKVYDVLGGEVKTLVNERLNAGSYETTFDATGLASGVYFYRLSVSPAATPAPTSAERGERDLVPFARDSEARDFVSTKKLILLR